MQGKVQSIKRPGFGKTEFCQNLWIIGGIPWQADHRLEIKAVHENPAVVIDARIVWPADCRHSSLAQDFGGFFKKGVRRFQIVFALKKTKKADFIFVVFVVGTIDYGSNAADRASITLGNERDDLPVTAVKCRFRG